MDKTLTAAQAWEDFYDWIRQQPKWAEMENRERQRVYEANAAHKGQRAHNLGYARLKDILQTYAPGRYEFNETVILKDGTS